MTGTLELDDLPKLDQMVNNFTVISKPGPDRILRGEKQTATSTSDPTLDFKMFQTWTLGGPHLNIFWNTRRI